MEEKVDMVLEDKEQGKYEEVTRPRVIEPHQPSVPFPQLLAKAKLEDKFGKFLEVLKKQ